MVKSLKERMAEKREAREANGPSTVTTIATPRPEPTPCRTCGSPVTAGAYCNACRAVRAQMTVARPKPEPPKEKKPVSTSVATNHVTRTIEPPKIDKPSIEPDRIKAIRKQHGMTQAELAQHLNVSTASVTYWETSRTNPSPTFVEQILKLESQAPATIDAPAEKDDSAATVAVAGPMAGEDTPLATAEEAAKFVPDINDLNRRLVEAQDKAARIAVPEYPTDPSELAQQITKRPGATVAVQASVATHFTSTDRAISLRDNLDAFRLLVRTFGIDTADRIVDLLRA
jgi:DNA-binding transcriptional regulator YiaG